MFPSLRGRLSELWQLTSWLGFPGGSDGKKEKDLPAMPETWVHSLGQEDPLEKGMATQSSILAWRILWTEEPGRVSAHRVTKSRTRLKRLSTHTHMHAHVWLQCGHHAGNPFQLVGFQAL